MQKIRSLNEELYARDSSKKKLKTKIFFEDNIKEAVENVQETL